MEGWLSRNGIFSLQTFSPLAGAEDFSGLATFVDGDDLDLLATCRLLQAANHLFQDGKLVERQLAFENGLWGLLALDQTPLQVLHKRHCLLHLAHLANLGVEFLVVNGEVHSVEELADKVDVLLLPGRILLRRIDGEFLRFAWVEAGGLSFRELLGKVGF